MQQQNICHQKLHATDNQLCSNSSYSHSKLPEKSAQNYYDVHSEQVTDSLKC